MLSSKLTNETERVPKFSAKELANLCGVLHKNIHLIEQHLGVNIKLAKNGIEIYGKTPTQIRQTNEIIKALHPLSRKPIGQHQVEMMLRNFNVEKNMPEKIILGRKTLTARNKKQAEYLQGIDKFDLNIAVGPAGTGKTYLAVAKAIEMFEKGEVQRMIFVRPAVEAGEKLGFLPGDLVEKVLPFLRPIYDALYEMLGFKDTQKLLQNDIIEILPLAFMRGRTLNDAFIILDEAQNATIMQMKMFLTRIGFGSKTVVTGDVTQVDLPKDINSGLKHVLNLLKDYDKIATHKFTSREVVRHPLVSLIIDAYEKDENK